MGSRRGIAGAVRHRAGRDAGFDERPAQGPARGRRGHAGVLHRLRGRPLLRQRLAHHRRDGRRLGAAAEARRRRLVRRRRPVGRAGDDASPAARATRATRCRRSSGLLLRRTDFVPDGRRAALFGLELANPTTARQDRDGQGRRPLRAARRLSVVGQHGPPDRGRQPPGQRGLPRRRARRSPTPARSPAPRPTTTPRWSRSTRTPEGADLGAGLPRPAARHGLQGRRQGRPVRLRRRPARQGHRRPAALQGHRPGQGPRGRLDRGRRLRRRHGRRQARADAGAARP